MHAPYRPDAPDPEEIRRLFPDLRDDQLVEAGENFDAYIESALRIYERIRSNPEAYRQFRACLERDRNESSDKPPALA